MKGERVSAAEAARVLGVSRPYLCEQLRKGNLKDIGEAVPVVYKRTGRQKFRYLIYRAKVLNRIGLDKWPEDL